MQEQVQRVLDAISATEQNLDSFSQHSAQLDEQIVEGKAKLELLQKDFKVKQKSAALLNSPDEAIAQLTALLNSSQERMDKLQEEWKQHKEPLEEVLKQRQQEAAKRKEEIKVTVEQIKAVRQQAKAVTSDIPLKEEKIRVLEIEKDKIPQGTSRATFVKRIMEIVKNLKKQKIEIDKILEDIKNVQKQINALTQTMSRSEAVTEDAIFKEAKKDAHTKQVYKLFVDMREFFNTLMKALEDAATAQIAVRDLELRLESLNNRNSALNFAQIEADLAAVQEENRVLAKKAAT
eukprot:GILI01013217.1.p1 GENE.GILI01013217.1~~GILI01013217.1.p1  ORF type:complete len:338 (+),score=134.91 GILI01013217.1:142-1014(+)